MVLKPPTEAQEQAFVIEWANTQSARYPALKLLFHVPNGGSRNAIEAKHLKAQGVKSGVPDLILPVPMNGYGCLMIEMKRTKGGRMSENQIEYMQTAERFGNLCFVCYGAEDAIRAITHYLRGDYHAN